MKTKLDITDYEKEEILSYFPNSGEDELKKITETENEIPNE